MPCYEYQCKECGEITEITWGKMDGGPPCVACAHCRCLALKILSTVQHKGKKKGRM